MTTTSLTTSRTRSIAQFRLGEQAAGQDDVNDRRTRGNSGLGHGVPRGEKGGSEHSRCGQEPVDANTDFAIAWMADAVEGSIALTRYMDDDAMARR